MKNILIVTTLALVAFSTQAQDLITKTDGTLIKGKVISFQNNRLVIQQEDETEMTLPRKAVAEIKFDIAENKSIVTAKGVEAPVLEKNATKEVINAKEIAVNPAPVFVEKKAESIKIEAPLQIQSPAPIATNKTDIQSTGDVIGLDSRMLLSSPAFKERAVGVGRVAVNICLDADGNVVTAKFKAAGSTTLDSDLMSMAVQNAQKFKFAKGNKDECGVILYRFNLD
jgi:RNase P/RNase MRP subunit p29